MAQKSIKTFIDELYSNPPRKNYSTNKTGIHHIDDFWSLDILDLKDYGPEINTGHRYVLVIMDIFSKFGWTVPLKTKNAETIEDSFENILITSRRKPNLMETYRAKEFYNKIFDNFLNNNNIKNYSRSS